MADNDKRYYWLKLKRDFFKRHDIRIIEDMPNGKDYILFYLKLLCESVDHEGGLRFSDEIPYNEEMLATITNTNIDVVRSAIRLFAQLKMMEILDDGTYYMREVNKMLGSETAWAEKKRVYRATHPVLLPSHEDNVLAMSDKSKSKRKSKSKEKDIEIEENNTPSLVGEIIDYLNKVLGTKYSSKSADTKKHINARLAEGHTFEDFKVVIDKKYAEWGRDKEMCKFLRPMTLFGTKFESYLNQVGGVTNIPTYEESEDSL